MSNEVELEISGSSASAQQAWMQLIELVRQFNRQVQQVGAAGRRSTKETKEGFTGLERQIRNTVAGVFSLQAAIGGVRKIGSLVNQEFSERATARKGYKQQQVSQAEAFESLVFNKGAVGARELVQDILKNSGGIDFSDAFRETVAALSTRGSISEELAREVVKTVQKSRPALNSDERGEVITAVLNTLRAAPDLRPGDPSDPNQLRASAEKAAGFVFTAMTAAPQKEIGKFSKNMIAGMLSLQNLTEGNDDPRFLASLLIGLGQAGADPTGERTRNNAITSMSQVFQKMRSTGVLGEDAGLEDMFNAGRTGKGRKIIDELLGVFASEAHLKELEASRTKDQELKLKLRAESSMAAAIVQMFSDKPEETTFGKEFQKAMGAIPEQAELAKRLEEMTRAVQENPLFAAKRAELAMNQARQLARQDPGLALQSVFENDLPQLFVDAGGSPTVEKARGYFRKFLSEMETDDALTAILKDIDRRQNRLAYEVIESKDGDGLRDFDLVFNQGVADPNVTQTRAGDRFAILNQLEEAIRELRNSLANRDAPPVEEPAP